MSGDSESSERDRNPLAGVLDRLLNRERGGPAAPVPEPVRDVARPEEARPRNDPVRSARRMLPVAGLGTDGGDAALRSAAQWTLLLGMRPSITDLCCQEPAESNGEGAPPPARDDRVPRARMACELERLRREPAEVVLALLDRLHRHERASDLTIVRLPTRQRRALMRAAFLAGTLVVPVDDSDVGFGESIELSREVLDNFHEVSVWPYSASPARLQRFLEAILPHGDRRVAPFDPGRVDMASSIEGLRAPPTEGFLIGLLAPEPTTLPERLLRVDSVEI